VVENFEAQRATPSVISFSEEDERLTGVSAARNGTIDPENTVRYVKKLLGRKFSDLEVKKLRSKVKYKIVRADNGVDAHVELRGKKYSPSFLASLLIRYLRNSVEGFLERRVSRAVIAVPTYFDDQQRKAIIEAGKLAGLNVLRLINEPTAAALAYGLDRHHDGEIVAVFDFGATSFDVSIIEIQDGVFEVKATNGDPKLGGELLTEKLARFFLEKFQQESGIDLSEEQFAVQRFYEAANAAKIKLDRCEETQVNMPFLTQTPGAVPKHFEWVISRQFYEDLVQRVVDRVIAPCEVRAKARDRITSAHLLTSHSFFLYFLFFYLLTVSINHACSIRAKQCMKDAGIRKYDVKHVIMVGASTRMPRLRQAAQEIFDRKPLTSINCEEVVAYGAGVLGGVLKSEVKDVLALQTTPLSIGVETLGGAMATLIPRNTLLPHQVNQMITTAWDNQKEATIKVYQGEREMVADNKLLGEFKITNIPPGPRGSVDIELIMVLDEDGLMNVTAINRNTGTEENLIVNRINDVSDEHIESAIKSAEQTAKSDFHRRRLVELRAEIDALIDSAKLSLDINTKFLSEKLRNQVIKGIENIKTARESDDPKFLDKKIDEFGLISESVRLAICGEDPDRKPKQNVNRSQPNFAEFSDIDVDDDDHDDDDDKDSRPMNRRKSKSVSDGENDSDYSSDEDDKNRRLRLKQSTNNSAESEFEAFNDLDEVDYRTRGKKKRFSYDEDDTTSESDGDTDSSDDKYEVEDDDVDPNPARRRRRKIRGSDHEHDHDEEPTNHRTRNLNRRYSGEDSDDDVSDEFRPLRVKRRMSGHELDDDEEDEFVETNRRTSSRESESFTDYDDTDDEFRPSQKKRQNFAPDDDVYDGRMQSTRRRKVPRDSHCGDSEYSEDEDDDDDDQRSPYKYDVGDEDEDDSIPAYKGRRELLKEASKHSVLASILYDDYEDNSEETYDSETFSGYEHDSNEEEEEEDNE
jgi:molecular chaperone DnaK